MASKLTMSAIAIAVGMSISTLTAGCSHSTNSVVHELVRDNSPNVGTESSGALLFDFDDGLLPEGVSINEGDLEVVEHGDGYALRVHLDGTNHPIVTINFSAPEAGWNWSGKDNYGLAFDVTNPGEQSTQLHFNLNTSNGGNLTRASVIAAGDTVTFYAELKSPLMALDSGIRGDPATILGDSVWMAWMWGDKALDYSSVASFGLYSRGLKYDRDLIIDNVRLVVNPPLDEAFLTHIVDKYGQNAKTDFVGKIHSDAELATATQLELKELSKVPEFNDRSQYGGWKNGPQLEATGYFRTEKVGERWAIIDPEGYMFFSNGIANMRLSNNGTITGYQYDKSEVVQRTPEDLDPEHSIGLYLQDMPSKKTRRLVSELRRNMFEWLPEAGEELDDNYGYRREVNVGALKHGESFSFYRANLQRKYADHYPDFMAKWTQVAIARMRHWGLTSTGNWADHSLYNNGQVPYFADGWIIGDYNTVSSGFDFWGAIPDPFDPKFAERANLTVSAIAERVADNPWCIGVFIDNEISWGRPETQEQTFGIVIYTLSRDVIDTPAKAAFMRILKDRYLDIAALNEAWGTDFVSWGVLDAGVRFDNRNDAVWADFSTLLEAFATEYFRVVHDAVEHHMPNHMYLGPRMASWARPIEVIRAAAKHSDVISYNEYRETIHPKKWEHLDEIDMPAIIGEWHIGALDRGSFHGGLVWAQDQLERGRMYEEYMQAVLENPYFVGAHWFQYTDSELTGRAMDGENYNVGYVSVTDQPYPELVESTMKVNRSLYEIAFRPWVKANYTNGNE